MSQPEQPPRFFLDRSLGRKAVPEALRADGWDVITLAEHYGIPADENVADTEWIEEAAQHGWAILITRGDLPSADMVQRFITSKAAILATAADPGPYIYSVQTDRISRLYP